MKHILQTQGFFLRGYLKKILFLSLSEQLQKSRHLFSRNQTTKSLHVPVLCLVTSITH